ncbi:hypothetical protein L2E82_10300 [Cichorium intybus]|uniref:Uncharacterized protein n=1 Tax=Cichorium intybus TaxID=13427 RepID=A0ACB9GA27_CICIN|nr:hypothetical protein L2E82_10300 [Cichorium intybus]
MDLLTVRLRRSNRNGSLNNQIEKIKPFGFTSNGRISPNHHRVLTVTARRTADLQVIPVTPEDIPIGTRRLLILLEWETMEPLPSKDVKGPQTCNKASKIMSVVLSRICNLETASVRENQPQYRKNNEFQNEYQGNAKPEQIGPGSKKSKLHKTNTTNIFH